MVAFGVGTMVSKRDLNSAQVRAHLPTQELTHIEKEGHELTLILGKIRYSVSEIE